MSFIIRLLRTLFGIYAIIIFVCSLIIAFILYILVFTMAPKKSAPFIAHQNISRPWAAVLFFFFGIRLKLKNKHALRSDQTYVFVANHRSQLDIPAYAIATPHTIRFLAKAELTKIPMMGFIIKRLYISVDRSDKAARARSMENMMDSLRAGISVFICPEGTRNKGKDPLLPFHDGAFRLAIQAQVPVAMLVLKNAENLLSPLRPIELSPGRIDGVWLEPIETKGMTADDVTKLREKAQELMAKELS